MGNSNALSKQYSNGLNIVTIIVVMAGVMYAQTIITQILMALFISIICAEPIYWLKKRKVPQGLAVAITLMGIVVIFMVFGQIIGTSLSTFSNDAPKYEQNLHEMSGGIIEFASEHGVNFSKSGMTELYNPSKIFSVTTGFLGYLGEFMGNIITIFFLLLFILMEIDSFPVKIKAIVKMSGNSLAFLHNVGKNIRHYLFIKTVTSFLTGGFIWVSLTVIGVDYAIIWALIAFMLNYIPNFGSIIAAIPAVLFALVQLGFGGALWTIGIFVIVNMLIGNIIEPKMMGKGMGLSTFIVFVSLIFWGFILGTVGMFLSVPITMSLKIILNKNPETKWIAIILGTQNEAQSFLDGGNDVMDDDS